MINSDDSALLTEQIPPNGPMGLSLLSYFLVVFQRKLDLALRALQEAEHVRYMNVWQAMNISMAFGRL